jgi:carboxymethylenebutenolidase
MPDYLATAPGGGPPVLLLHTWWGLNQVMKDLADRLAADGFTVLAPDLFDGRVLTTIEEADAHGQEMDAQGERIHGVVAAALDELLARDDVQGDRAGIVALSFGGWYGRQLVGQRNDVAALVSIYSDVYDAPEGVAYQGHFAADDDFVAAPSVPAADETYVYPGTKHWFMESDRPEHDAHAEELAYGRVVEFLRRHLT